LAQILWRNDEPSSVDPSIEPTSLRKKTLGENAMSSSKGKLHASVAAVQILVSASVLAQDSNSAADRVVNLDEVVVTATKREQKIQDIPAAISAVSGQALDDRGISDPSDLQFITPSLQVGKSQGNTAFTIRGVGFNTVGSPAVAVHVDGVFQPRPALGDLAQIDVERVEVLRGPQGTLYGRNANGGVINFLTKRPTKELEGSFKARYASYDETLLEGVVNVPLGDRAGARLVLSHNNQGKGFVRNIAGGPDLINEGHDAARLALDFDFTDNLSLELTGSYVERDGSIYSSIAQTTPFTTGPRGAPFGNLFAFRGNLYAALGAVHTTEPNRTTANDPSNSDRRTVAFTSVLNWDINNFQFKSITGYQEFSDRHSSDFDGTNVTIYQGRIIRDSETWTQEFDLTGRAGPVDLTLGLFYLDETYAQDLSINEPNGNGAFQPNALLSFVTPYYDSKAVAGFMDATWNISDNFRLIGGLRRSKDKQNTFQNFNIFARVQISPVTTITLGNQCNAALPQLDYSSTTPRVGMQFDFNENSTVYGNYSEGFKVGGYNTDGTCNDVYLPEKIKAYEFGWKNSLLDGALTFNATGFFYDYNNLQLQQIIGTGVTIINAPKAEIKGLELETSWRASERVSLFGSLAFLNAKYKEFFNVNGASASTAPVDLKGNRLNSAPKASINAGFEFQPSFAIANGSLRLRSDLSYRSALFLREFNDPVFERQGAYTIVNSSVTWASAGDKFALRGFVTNLFNEDYLTQAQWSAPINSRSISWGQPRQYGVEMQVKF
jgi:iron complex outermembrane receptor protein